MAELDARIALIEQRIVARETDVRQQLTVVSRRANRVSGPLLLGAVAVVGLTAGHLLVRALHGLFRSRRRVRPADLPAGYVVAESAPPPPSGLPWGQLLLLALPLIIERARLPMRPSTARALASLALPLTRRRWRQHRPGVVVRPEPGALRAGLRPGDRRL